MTKPAARPDGPGPARVTWRQAYGFSALMSAIALGLRVALHRARKKAAVAARAHRNESAEVASDRDTVQAALERSEQEQRQLAGQLEAEKARLLAAQAVAKVGSWETDLGTLTVTWSAEVHRIFETDPDTFQPTHQAFLALIHPDDRAAVDAAFLRSVSMPGAQAIDHRLLLPDGRVKFVEERWRIFTDGQGRPTHAIGTCQDISVRKQAENALRESNEQFHQLADNITDAFWVRSADMQKVHYVSPAFERIWGRSVATLYANPHQWTEFIWPGDRERVVSAFDALAVAGSNLDIEYRIVRPDGETRWIGVRGFQVRDAAGMVIRHIGIVNDMTGRKRAETALQESLEEFRMLAEAMPHIVWIARPDGWNVYFNHQWMDYTGLSAEQSHGHGWNIPFHPDDQQRTLDAWQRATATGGIYSVEGRLRRADGAYRWWLLRGVPVSDASGQIVKWFGTCTDIHDLKAADLEISRTNRALKMLSSCNEALIRAKFEPALLHEVCRIAVDLGAYRMAWVGYAQDDDEQSVTPIAHGGFEDGYLAEISVSWSAERPGGKGPAGRAIRTGETVVCEDLQADPAFAPWAGAAIQRGYRGVILLPLRGATRIFGVLALYSAEVQQVSAEELALLKELADDLAFGIGNLRLQQEQQRLGAQVREQAALLDIADDAIYLRNLDGVITYWNKGAERAYGRTSEEVLGHRAVDLLPRNVAEYQQAEAEFLVTGEWHGEMARRTKSDRDITMAVRWTLVRDADGRPKAILAVNTDVTEKKRLESQFLRAQRMEGIGTLAGGIAHDLNNVLAPIVMSIEMLRGVITDPDGLSLLETLEVSANRGAALVGQVLSFARGVEGQQLVVKPLEVLRDLLGVMRDTFPRSIEVQFAAPIEPWTVMGDPTQMQQVFLNLCINARDAMPEGGTLAICVENVVFRHSEISAHPDARPGPYVRVSVKDSGHGIPPSIRDKVFEPFFTTKGIGKGTGLGLSTTLAIVKSQGGFIHLQSTPSDGTTFSVYLPASSSAAAAPVGAPAKDPGLPRGHGELILVVDDEAAIRTVARRALERFGYRVMVAGNGAEALELYIKHEHEIAAVLTDMSMPVMDGAALITQLEAVNPQVRIIGSSGLLSAAAMTGPAARPRHFIAKPYTASDMLKTVQTALQP